MNQPPTDADQLKRIAFEAEEVCFGEADYGIEVFSAAAVFPEHGPIPHVVLMRSHSDPPTSLHLDCNYALYGGVYGAVARAEVSPAGLRLDLRTDMAVLLRKLGGFDITWTLPAEQYEQVVAGLKSLFRDTEILTVAGD